ncbi:MBL fold metallo-hydrolase [Bradyrhizobium sp. U87765 SZCCT0131]|uniref:MBL fold metallo-hydrolase n=1 Tax=unclassified Bradyrhizobium TaxID=2631580 RepID=UPI001BA6EF20|nr:MULTISPECIES: MBL fold metallo-hydrolase [unclassified Bradyrhizobium]MBR1220753.1 MBL fold metallo-hydrolase [Bradyrhizobium sp. U87765 SZCCT0131]MBR1260427.1 MBL fold metallo-hydrolase [Bradyrhizobium sp. U87765 SZCCT0134]MBR1307324.1 MBL fold metallo-hydrolase [Bradyrhizobium sp. U87765 SZCCT0110]MBR1321278.1 MBL fold metallo-hydrolase [Bradyrhizobium sp. U87765 SZCCT0109]MBR1349591.1 MBL fold metallo-hydrolase [Bradyrhizobium sp. U87765 SZCCT0048]
MSDPTGRRPSSRTSGAITGGYQFSQGSFEITVASDGFITVPIDIVAPDRPPDERANILSVTGDPKSGVVISKTNIPVIRSRDDLIIIDVGAGKKYQSTDGTLSANLHLCGIDPTEVTKVVFSHAHPDHIWGTLTETGSLRFPNASYYVGAAEWDFWMDPDYLTNMPAELHEFAAGARRDLGAVKDRVVMLMPGDDIVAGLRALDTAGHTPGHLSFEIAGGDGLIVSADAATNEIASFQHPKARFGYDTLPDLAIKNRARLIERAARDRIKLLGYHWTYPGIGYAERAGVDSFRYVAAQP